MNPHHVLSGKTFTNASTVGGSGSMANKSSTTVDASAVSQDNTYAYLTIPAAGYYDTNSKIRTALSNVGGGGVYAPTGTICGVSMTGGTSWHASSIITFVGVTHTLRDCRCSVSATAELIPFMVAEGQMAICTGNNRYNGFSFLSPRMDSNNISVTGYDGTAGNTSTQGSGDNDVKVYVLNQTNLISSWCSNSSNTSNMAFTIKAGQMGVFCQANMHQGNCIKGYTGNTTGLNIKEYRGYAGATSTQASGDNDTLCSIIRPGSNDIVLNISAGGVTWKGAVFLLFA